MDVRDCYRILGGDYDEVLARFCNREELARKFLYKFLDDQSYGLLMESLHEQNMEEAFRAAHTLKGVSQNLGFDRLQKSAGELTEALRSGKERPSDALVEQVREDYKTTAEAIQMLRESVSD